MIVGTLHRDDAPVSLWTMIKVKVVPLLICMDHLARAQAGVNALTRIPGLERPGDHPLDPAAAAKTGDHLRALRTIARELDLTVTAVAVDRLLKRMASPAVVNLQSQHDDLKDISMRLLDEVGMLSVLAVESRDLPFLEPAEPLFGAMVDAAFPSARFDVAEAGKCFALERDTAAAMHLVRALEPVLRSLSQRLNLDAAPNWNTALNQAERVIRDRSVQRPPEETAWLTSVATHFRFLKDAFRNDVMHGARRFGRAETRELFEGVGPFMRVAALELNEPGADEFDEVTQHRLTHLIRD